MCCSCKSMNFNILRNCILARFDLLPLNAYRTSTVSSATQFGATDQSNKSLATVLSCTLG